jgi:hypothetical protein
MTLRTSTGLRNAMMVTGSLKSQLDGGYINIYGGAPPTDADSSIGASTILCTVTLNGTATGLTIDAVATNGACTKANEVWSGINLLSGTATYWRFILPGDTGGASTTAKRLQGLASTSGSELVMTSINLVAAAPQNVDFFSVGLPA